MKIFLTILWGVLVLPLTAQIQDYQTLEAEGEMGKCYSPVNFSDSTDKDSVYLEFVPPVLEVQYKTLDEIRKEYPNRWDEMNGLLKTSPDYTKIVERKRGIENYKNVMCWVEVPSRYENVEKVVIPKATGHIEKYTNRKLKMIVQKTELTIRKISAVEAANSKNPVAKVAKNTKWQEVLLPVCGDRVTVREIQKALNKKGYYCEVNGILDETMKHIILEFQEDYKLPQGRLDIYLFKALELRGYK
jgi:hypothetical protein